MTLLDKIANIIDHHIDNIETAEEIAEEIVNLIRNSNVDEITEDVE